MLSENATSPILLAMMLPFWTFTILLVVGTLANQDSGKYQILLFYELRRFMVDAFGEGGNRIAPNCPSPCDLKAFMIAVTDVKKVNQFIGGHMVRDASGRPITKDVPDYNAGDFSKLTDNYLDNTEKDYNLILREAGEEIDKLGFKGLLLNQRLFRGWVSGPEDNFAKVMTAVQSAIDDTRQKRKSDGNDPDGGRRFDNLKKSVEAMTNARRMNNAGAVITAFNEVMGDLGVGFKVFNDVMERVPVPAYRLIDIEGTISQNGVTEEWKKRDLRKFVNTYNAGKGRSHITAIEEGRKLSAHLETPFQSAPGCTL